MEVGFVVLSVVEVVLVVVLLEADDDITPGEIVVWRWISLRFIPVNDGPKSGSRNES